MTRRPARTAEPAFLFFGAFGVSTGVLDQVAARVVARYGPLHPHGTSAVSPFPDTVAYRKTMGSSLLRRFFVLARRWPQDGLAAVKRAAIAIEDEIAAEVTNPPAPASTCRVERPVNVDPGLIDGSRVILASTRDRPHRLYRGDGIWEEVTLVWRDGEYHALPWTYPDFTRAEYHEFFARFRAEFLGR